MIRVYQEQRDGHMHWARVEISHRCREHIRAHSLAVTVVKQSAGPWEAVCHLSLPRIGQSEVGEHEWVEYTHGGHRGSLDDCARVAAEFFLAGVAEIKADIRNRAGRAEDYASFDGGAS